MTLREKLLTDIEAFRERHNMTVTGFGIEALNDPAFLGRFRAGHGLYIDTADKLRAFMAERDRATKRESSAA